LNRKTFELVTGSFRILFLQQSILEAGRGGSSPLPVIYVFIFSDRETNKKTDKGRWVLTLSGFRKSCSPGW